MSLVGGLMVMHARADGVKTFAHFGITGAWMLLSSLQILGAIRLHRAYEVLFSAFSVSVLSCLFQAQERTELLALRSFVFVIANATLPYLGVMLQYPDIDTYVNACRTLLILMGEPEIASAWVVVYILCIGYQVRNTTSSSPTIVASRKSHAQHLVKYSTYQYLQQNNDDYDEESSPLPQNHDQHNSSDSHAKQPTPSSIIQQQQHSSIATASIVNQNSSSSSEEAALLREALASRKGYRDA
jgi:uncharacterized membrane protein